jgi:AraC-like DNA-binding protein/mannose-6-phosphate isomerase-like protein (cupin superfamily)
MPKVNPVTRATSSVIESQINAEGVHQWPFNPDFPIDVLSLAIDHHPVRMNRHDYFEVLYAYSGQGTFQVQERNFTIKEGDLFVAGSTVFHRAIQSGRKRLEAVVVYFLPDLLYRDGIIDEEVVEYLMPFLAQDSSFGHLVPAETGLPMKVLPWIEQIHEELPAASREARLRVKTYLRMILILLGRYYKNDLRAEEVYARKERDIKRLRPLFEFMDEHYSERISLEDSSSIVGMSKSHFKRLFKRVTGQTFVAYLNRFRIAKAQAMLTSTDRSIAEISQEVGFCSQSHLGIIFQKYAHTSPLHYRKQQLR